MCLFGFFCWFVCFSICWFVCFRNFCSICLILVLIFLFRSSWKHNLHCGRWQIVEKRKSPIWGQHYNWHGLFFFLCVWLLMIARSCIFVVIFNYWKSLFFLIFNYLKVGSINGAFCSLPFQTIDVWWTR